MTELMSPYDIETFIEKTDIIQVGARNMQNFELLKEAADLTISKNLSFPISMYELKEVQGLTEAELDVFKKCQKIGVRDLLHCNLLDNNGNKIYNNNHLFSYYD